MQAEVLTYTIEAGICLAAFYAVYWLVLRNETFHKLNRFFLVAAICLSFIIPALHVSVPVDQTRLTAVRYAERVKHGIARFVSIDRAENVSAAAVEGIKKTGEGTVILRDTEPPETSGAGSILFSAYLLGVILLLARLAVQAGSLFRIMRRGRKTKINGCRVIEVKGDISPCCFMNAVLINPDGLSAGDLDRIIGHERVHIDQRHGIDNVLAQIAAVVLWFNPFAWLCRRALGLTHEYLADAAVCRRGEGPAPYQELLLKQMIWSRSFELADGLNLRAVKKRMAMMTRSVSSGRARLKVLAVLPVASLLFLLFVPGFEPVEAGETASGTREKEHAMKAEADPYAPVVLDDVRKIFIDVLKEVRDKDYVLRSYIYMQLACMRAAGWTEMDYETLMPVSGFGLTFAYHPKEHAEAHFWPPAGTDARVTRATGFGWEYKHHDDIEACWHDLKETIDSGRPIHAPHMEEVLFIGYQDAESKEDRKVRPIAIPVFVSPGAWWSWKEFQEWFDEFGGHMGRFTERKEKLGDREAAVEVMETLVKMAFDDPRSKRERFAEVKWGLEGIEAFAADMADLSKGEEDFCSGWFGCHDSNPQWTARQLTGRYLEKAADLFDGEVRALIRGAAGDYAKAHEAWLEWDKHLGPSSCDHAWRDKKGRLAGAAAARGALDHERNAVEKIREALGRLK